MAERRAEYFRDVADQDVLLLVDNIFRFVQAGSEVSTLLGRMPSAGGYQPTLADEMGQLRRPQTLTTAERRQLVRLLRCGSGLLTEVNVALPRLALERSDRRSGR